MPGRDPREVLKDIRAALAEARRQAEAEARRQRAEETARRADADLFRAAVVGAARLDPGTARARLHRPAPPPLPLQRARDEQQALAASLSDGIDGDALIDSDAELSFARPGVGDQAVRRLRRGDWAVQGHLDLHGMTRDQARQAVADFLGAARISGQRCLRIVHGKGLGSVNREPVLKALVRRWLVQDIDVLAFAQARGSDGGAGAVLVLLRGSGGAPRRACAPAGLSTPRNPTPRRSR
ncbi:MAG: Smr/MutS family protein [Burkholderiales bacterium]|nr:Smr/MutS family protein [Burkholderiales bacterium]